MSAGTRAPALPAGLDWPRTAHRPGTGTAPDRERLAAMRARCAQRTRSETWAENDGYRCGVALYGAGLFWEAHEIWEPVWLRCAPNGRERAIVGALIALTNACLKLSTGRRRAALRLLADTGARLGAPAPAQRPCMGLSPARLAGAVAAFEARVAGAGDDEARAAALVEARPPVEPTLSDRAGDMAI